MLEGETLERMRGALPWRKALDFSAQIARGLAAAHEKGIVHRDLKRLDLSSGSSQLVRELLPVKPAGMLGQFRILASADGRSNVYSRSRVRGDLVLIEGLR